MMLACTDRDRLPLEAASEPDLELPSSPAPARARPLVSVIIPAWNAARFIGETLASAQAQTWPNLEIIVVDDGSTDATAAIVAAAASTDPRITLIRQANAGVAAARNAAIAAARGEYVAPLDADDLWHPENVQAQVEALERAGPGTAVAYTWHALIDEAGSVCGLSDPFRLTTGQAALARLIEGQFIGNASSTVIRRQCLREAGGYDPSLRARGAQGCEDLALYIALAERWDYCYVPRNLVGYRLHRQAMSCDDAQMERSRDIVLAELERRNPRARPALAARDLGKGIRYADAALFAAAARRAWNTGCLVAATLHLPRTLSIWLMRFVRPNRDTRQARALRQPGCVVRLPLEWSRLAGRDPEQVRDTGSKRQRCQAGGLQ